MGCEKLCNATLTASKFVALESFIYVTLFISATFSNLCGTPEKVDRTEQILLFGIPIK